MFVQAIVNVIGMPKMTPPIKDLLPRLTPVLKNRHEKVQENCIDLVGRIADRGAEFVPAREWMRICFELLEMLKAHKKGIRCSACLASAAMQGRNISQAHKLGHTMTEGRCLITFHAAKCAASGCIQALQGSRPHEMVPGTDLKHLSQPCGPPARVSSA